MQCTVNWTGALETQSPMGFVAETGSGHIVPMDGAPDAAKPELGGRNLAARPMELLLAGMGGCTAYDVVLILKRGRHDVQGCTVKIDAQRADTDPKVFTAINLHFVVTGRGLKPETVQRAVDLSHEKILFRHHHAGQNRADHDHSRRQRSGAIRLSENATS